MNRKPIKALAAALSELPPFTRGKRTWAQNQKDWHLSMSKLDKLLCGGYLIMHDYAEGLFPPRFPDREEAYAGEMDYARNLPGLSHEDVQRMHMRKPFWFGKAGTDCLRDFVHVVESFNRFHVRPPQSLLELGCGSGWMAEFLSTMGFDVTATSISSSDIDLVVKRARCLQEKGIAEKLRARAVPMESVDEDLSEHGRYDAVYVYEALHHAFDWREALAAAYACLKDNGTLFLFNEPNAIHTLVSYRVGRLSNTHEIGYVPGTLVKQLKAVGFRKIRYTKNRCHWFLKPISLCAVK